MLSKITSFDLFLGQGKLLFIKCLFFLLSIRQWPFEVPNISFLVRNVPLSISGPFLHVVSLTLWCIWDSYTCVCIKFSYLLLLICFMPIWLLDQLKDLEGRGKFVPPPQYQLAFTDCVFQPFFTCVLLSMPRKLSSLTFSRAGRDTFIVPSSPGPVFLNWKDLKLSLSLPRDVSGTLWQDHSFPSSPHSCWQQRF